MSGLGLSGYRDRIRKNSAALQPAVDKAVNDIAKKTVDVATKVTPVGIAAKAIADKFVPKKTTQQKSDRAEAIKRLSNNSETRKIKPKMGVTESRNRFEEQAAINKKYNQ